MPARLCNLFCYFFGVVVLPAPDDDPAGGIESQVDLLVALAVSLQLRRPVRLVALRCRPVQRAAVSEAAIEEDGESCLSEDDVRSHPDGGRRDGKVHAEPQTASMEGRTERPLRFGASSKVPTSDRSCRCGGRRRIWGMRSATQADLSDSRWSAHLDSEPRWYSTRLSSSRGS